MVAQGESPMHRAASKCLWGAFGCPGDGGVQEWKLVWISFRTQADEIWCKVGGGSGVPGRRGILRAKEKTWIYHS